MQTPWGSLPVCDTHVHFFSHRFFASLATQKHVPIDSLSTLLHFTIPPPEAEDLADVWHAELDRHQVNRAALIASMPGDEESVSTAVARHPGRFRGFFLFDPTAPGAPARLETALASGRLHGVCLFPAMHRYSVAEERVRFVFDIAKGHPGTIVFVHCGVLSVGIRAKLGLPSLFDMRFSNPIDLHAVALAYPQLNFIVPHFGAGYFREALMLCDLCPNVYLDTSSSNRWVRFQPEAFDLAAVFRRALDVCGPERLLFGSDSSFLPRGWNQAIFSVQAQTLFDMGVREAHAALIFGGNFNRLFP